MSGEGRDERRGEKGGRTVRLAVLAAVALGVAAAGALLVWFIAFSGLNEPVGFIYGGF